MMMVIIVIIGVVVTNLVLHTKRQRERKFINNGLDINK